MIKSTFEEFIQRSRVERLVRVGLTEQRHTRTELQIVRILEDVVRAQAIDIKDSLRAFE